MKNLENKRIVSAIASNGGIEMSKEVLENLQKSNKRKADLTADIIIDNLVEIYGNVENSKMIATNDEFVLLSFVYTKLNSIYNKFLLSKETFEKTILEDYADNCEIRPTWNFYNATVEIKICELKECISDWLDDFENHLLHLEILMSKDFEQKNICVLKCYIETVIIFRKLQDIIDTSSSYFEDVVSMQGEDEEPLFDKKVFSNVEFLKNMYDSMYEDMNIMRDNIFIYINKFEKIIKENSLSYLTHIAGANKNFK